MNRGAGGLQSMESHRVGHDWATNTFTNTGVSVVKNPLANQCRRSRFDQWIGKISRRRKWQPTPVFLPEKSHGQRRLWVFAQSLQLYLTLCDPMECSPPGSSVSWLLQARILEWVAIPFSRGSSQPRDWTQVSHIAGRFSTVWATREAHTHICIHYFLYTSLLSLGFYTICT